VSHLPAVTPHQMSEVNLSMVETLDLDIRQIMETAGQAVARFARARMLGGDPRGRRVVALCGSGGNGGDAMVAARVLQGWGAEVTVVGVRPGAEMRGVTGQQAAILDRCGLPVLGPDTPLPAADLVLDGILGFSLRGDPIGPQAALIEAAIAQAAPVLAIDLPSGLDGETGHAATPCVVAAATLTLGLPKVGLATPAARRYTGPVTVGDIGIPQAAYAAAGIVVGPVFAHAEFIDWP
jgi:NAD(P)H-hydrate epimerase